MTRTHPARRESIIAAILVLCTLLVAFWQVMAFRSRRPWVPFTLTAADFASGELAPPGWDVRRRAVSSSPTDPNIIMYEMRRRPSPDDPPPDAGGRNGYRRDPVLARLVHGYNMPDCMRIKHYGVVLLADTHGSPDDRRRAMPLLGTGEAGRARREGHALETDECRLQFWRLTSSVGDVSIWVTSMLRAGDMLATPRDVRSMPFPRVGIPDDPDWMPEGVTWEGLRHPIVNLRKAMRAKWNNSRCDWRVFLGLKQPPWASDEILTLVSVSAGGSVARETETQVARHVLDAHLLFHRSLIERNRHRPPGGR